MPFMFRMPFPVRYDLPLSSRVVIREFWSSNLSTTIFSNCFDPNLGGLRKPPLIMFLPMLPFPCPSGLFHVMTPHHHHHYHFEACGHFSSSQEKVSRAVAGNTEHGLWNQLSPRPGLWYKLGVLEISICSELRHCVPGSAVLFLRICSLALRCNPSTREVSLMVYLIDTHCPGKTLKIQVQRNKNLMILSLRGNH